MDGQVSAERKKIALALFAQTNFCKLILRLKAKEKLFQRFWLQNVELQGGRGRNNFPDFKTVESFKYCEKLWSEILGCLCSLAGLGFVTVLKILGDLDGKDKKTQLTALIAYLATGKVCRFSSFFLQFFQNFCK